MKKPKGELSANPALSDFLDECKEVVLSLAYADARFVDLPKLHDLKTLFNEKFGNSLEPYINKEEVDPVVDKTSSPAARVVVEMMYPICPEEIKLGLAPETPIFPMA
ncbi:hypothetical protein JHK86_042919 [Glycine max]|nr:hypothetical protein JHK86_042919 [Glycine max]